MTQESNPRLRYQRYTSLICFFFFQIKVINLASTCSIINREDEMEGFLIQAWMKACPKNIPHIIKEINKGSLWYYRYIEALVALTYSTEHIFHGSSANLVKVISFSL